MDFIKAKEIVIDEFIVLPQHNKLVLAEQEFKVEPKIMQVLCLLISHQGEVLSREAIVDHLWPDTVTGLEVVTRAIFELRKIFNDDAKQPKYIETIARRGYSFVFPISHTNKNDQSNAENTPLITRKARQPRHLYFLFLFVVVLISIIGYKVLSNANEAANYQANIITQTNSQEGIAAISPAGTEVVFIRREKTVFELIKLDLATLKEQVLLTSNNELRSPKWGKEHHHWFLLECAQNSCQLIDFNSETGSKEVVYDSPESIRSISYSAKSGNFTLEVISEGLRSIGVLQLEQPQNQLTLIQQPVEPKGKAIFSEDGRSIYYAAWMRRGSVHLYQYDISTQLSTVVNQQFERIFSLALDDQNNLLLAGRRQGRNGIWQLNDSLQNLQQKYLGSPGEFILDISAAGKVDSLIYKSLQRNIDVKMAGVQPEAGFNKLNSSMIEMNAIYSKLNGARYFVSNRTGSYELWRYKAGVNEKLTQLNANMVERPIISLSAGLLAFTTRLQGKTQLHIFDVKENKIVNTYILPNKAYLLSWNKDESGIYMSVNDGQQYNIHLFDLQNNQQKKVLLTSGLMVNVNSHNNTLYYIDMARKQLMVKYDNGDVKSLFKFPRESFNMAPHQVKVIDDVLYFINSYPSAKQLMAYSLTKNKLESVLELPANAYISYIGKEIEPYVIYDQLIKDQSALVHLQSN